MLACCVLTEHFSPCLAKLTLLNAEVMLVFLQLLYACCKVCVFALLCEGWKRRLVCFLSCIFFVFRHVDCWLFFFFSFRAAHTWRVSFVDSVTRCVAVRTFITMYVALPQWWVALHPLPGKTAVRVTIVQKIAAPDRTGTDSHLVRDKVCVYCVCACIYYTYIYI